MIKPFDDNERSRGSSLDDEFLHYLSGATPPPIPPPLPPPAASMAPESAASETNVEVKNSTGNIAMAVASAVPLSQVPDIESPPEPTANVVAQQATATALENEHDDQGKRLGIVLFCNILGGLITSFFLPFLSIVFQISAIIIASALTCGCCCAANSNLEPRVKKLAAATLVALCILIILQIIATVIIFTAVIEDGSSTGTISDSTGNDLVASLLPISISAYVAYALALVFSGLLSFGRDCGAPHASRVR